MAKSLYLINPRSSMPGYFGAEAFEQWGLPPAQSIADLATTTVAALAPPDWEIEICDEFVSPVDFDHPADYVGITGKITQAKRLIEIADGFRARGKPVIVGGPCASLTPEMLRGHCDALVIGELEGIAEQFFADLDSGDFEAEYTIEEKPDLGTSPVPRWDLYPNHRAIMGCVQTSRGCPFECEFCDVIMYLGRKQRHKPVEQIIAELDELYGYGYRAVFLADDNFTVYRRRAKEILAAIADWNASRSDGPVQFATQVSIDAARDPEIMRLCAEAGLTWVFIGIETPNEESLRETKKRQNLGIDLHQQIQVFLDHGMTVTGGMIVGFDHDGLDIFQRQFDFAMSTPIPIFSLSALVAPAATPLKDRMREAGRLNEGGSDRMASPWETNIVPASMTRDQLLDGTRWLCNSLYRPADFAQRVVQMIDALGPRRGPFVKQNQALGVWSRRPVEAEGLLVLKKIIRQGPEERRMWSSIFTAMKAKPESEPMVMQALFRYAQARCLYETGGVWEPQIAAQEPLQAVADAGATGGLVSIGG